MLYCTFRDKYHKGSQDCLVLSNSLFDANFFGLKIFFKFLILQRNPKANTLEWVTSWGGILKLSRYNFHLMFTFTMHHIFVFLLCLEKCELDQVFLAKLRNENISVNSKLFTVQSDARLESSVERLETY